MSASQTSADQEFVVRIPARNPRKTHHVMKFNGSLKIDLTQWTQGSVRMIRENNRKIKQQNETEEQPKFGAGSEFGREQREEARRKKFGISSKKYDPHAQPWLIRVGDKKTGKRYRGIREGGVSDNTSYYVFTHAQDGAFEAHPISEWYNFTPIQTYKTLNAEEAEEQFAHRGKILNHWALMVNKKLRPDAENLDDPDGDGGSSGKKKSGSKKGDSSFKISDMDDWVESGDELDSDSDEESGKKKKKKDEDSDDGAKKKNKDSKKKKKKTKEDVDNEAFEDSDDGDDECREVDYMSDESSDSETEAMEKLDSKGVDQDKGLAKMLDSESSSDEDEENKKKKDDEINSDKSGGSDAEESGDKDKKKKAKKDKKKNGKSSSPNSRAGTPEASSSGGNKAEKRKNLVDNVMDLNEPAPKKTRLEQFGSSTPNVSTPLSSNESALEEDVRRYLMRKPMTTTELVKKINSKKFQDLPKEELMPLLVNVLKKVNPIKTKTKGIMYLSLKSNKS